MFDSPADAADALLAYFERPRVEIVVEALVPAAIFHPAASGIAIGGTRLGGTPDAPAGFVWPRPARPDDPDEIARRGNEDAGREMRAHMALDLPYAFIAQVDLTEAAALGPAASALPSEGRLLFFYDLAIGPWDTGTRVARVIWERSPADALRPLAVPDDLAAAAAREAQERAAIAAEFGDGDEDVDEDAGGGTNYGAPARAMTLRQAWRLPDPHALEIAAMPDFAAVARGESDDPMLQDLFSAYEEALEEFGDRYPAETWQRQQLLGSPMPEQDDPRYDAVVVTGWGKQHLSGEEWLEHRDEVLLKAHDWTLLLQIDIGDWMQARFVEGTIYFLIRRDHLEKHRFDEVVAVYQQT
ncbi:MAG: YwqG family protein [Aquamicrobium sp.]|uniref:DUF1963 domain-containing protein n=1 Tax=Aquamicrobium sp. TaxID=1872579 RepID=UPI00349E497E|nr:YwqG family protein [Aquamicrobium sp.]